MIVEECDVMKDEYSSFTLIICLKLGFLDL